MRTHALLGLVALLSVSIGCPDEEDNTSDDDTSSTDDDSVGDDDSAGDDDITGDDDTADPCGNIAAGGVVFGTLEIDPVVVADEMGEWFELVNTTAAAVDLNGFMLYDQGSDFHVIGGPLIVAAGGALVLGNNADPATNGGVSVDYQYTDITLSNGSDELFLDCGGLVVDHVSW